MTSQNRVILTGKVLRSPQLRYRPDGSPVIQFSLELNDSGDRPGQALHHQGTGSLINIVAFGKLAELKLDLLQRGRHLMVVGRLNQRRWKTPEGKNRIRTEVIATEFRTVEEKSPTMD
jgi:single-strand DNA-binding protein